MSWPRHYAIKYSINPWMSLQNQVIAQKAAKQWIDLHHTIIQLGGYVHYVEPKPSVPDMVFTANSGFRVDKEVIVSSFKCKERQNETKLYKKWFDQNGYKTYLMPRGIRFEGAGDALACGDLLFCGYGFRSDIKAASFVKDTLKVKEVVSVKLVDPYFYHLDTCFCPLNENTALIYPNAFEKESLSKIKGRINIIEVVEEDAKKFACNAVVLGNQVIIPAGCQDTKEELMPDFVPHEIEMSEFIKAGGACKCLTLIL
jgi:N-dimethylarginine dimethylaminohydrolase